MQTNTCWQVALIARTLGQDVWANIWNAVLAVIWPFLGRRCAEAVAESGGAAVALARKLDYTQTRMKYLIYFSAHEGSPALMQVAPFLKSFRALDAFSLLERLRFESFEAVDEHQVEQQPKLFAGFARLRL